MSETWVLNSTLVSSTLDVSFTVNFMSNGNSYSKMRWTDIALPTKPYFGFYDETGVYLETGTWTNDAYRTLTFAIPPTGDLLTWLQANGTKQEETDIYTINLTVPNGINIKVGGKYVAEDIKVIPKLEDKKTITPSTIQQTATPEEGYIGLKKVTVNAIATEEKTQAASTSNVIVQPTSGKYLSKVTVTPTPSETKTATPTSASQSVTPSAGKLLSKVTVNAVPTETKSITPTKSAQTVTPTSGKFLSQVSVGAIPSEYLIPAGAISISQNGSFDVSKYKTVNVDVDLPFVEEIATASEMGSKLTTDNAGKYYKYTGTTSEDDVKYINGDIYYVEATTT